MYLQLILFYPKAILVLQPRVRPSLINNLVRIIFFSLFFYDKKKNEKSQA